MRFEEASMGVRMPRIHARGGPWENGHGGYTWLLFLGEREESARTRVYVAGEISRRLFTRGGSSGY